MIIIIIIIITIIIVNYSLQTGHERNWLLFEAAATGVRGSHQLRRA